MRLELRIDTESGTLLRLVREFAEGLGWTLASEAPSAVCLLEPEDSGADGLLHLLTHVALSAAKAGIPTSEPLCRIRFGQGPASDVTLAVRIEDLAVGAPIGRLAGT
jgi:hypothetical protein